MVRKGNVISGQTGKLEVIMVSTVSKNDDKLPVVREYVLGVRSGASRRLPRAYGGSLGRRTCIKD